jgi:uncharacterized protein YndB with AHSA1/START domain
MPKTEITAVPGSPLVTITRDFDAPRDLVFRAYTEPALLEQWLGPHGLTTVVERYETRDGGKWRYVQTSPDGGSHAFHGVFHGDPAPEAIVQTFEYEGVPGHVKLDSVTLTEAGGKTRVRTTAAFTCVEDRDAMVAAGMEYGVREGDERLAELLAKLQAG